MPFMCGACFYAEGRGGAVRFGAGVHGSARAVARRSADRYVSRQAAVVVGRAIVPPSHHPQLCTLPSRPWPLMRPSAIAWSQAASVS